MATNTGMTISEMTTLFNLLDKSYNLLGKPISADARARIFAVLSDLTQENWRNARSILVRGNTTLWQAVVAIGCSEQVVPSKAQIFAGLQDLVQNRSGS